MSGPEDHLTSYVLAIDQGTTSTRAMLFRADTSIAAVAQQEFPQHFPADGEVEHEPEDLWATTVATCRAALRNANAAASDVVAIGITNQRETTLLWDRNTGRAVHRAIVWQDRRTADLCARLKDSGHEPRVAAKTGLLLDPYFSGTKLAWLLTNIPGAADKAARGELAFGTVDTYLLWRLTGGRVHATDATNASRTLLFDIHKGKWDDELLKLLGVPKISAAGGSGFVRGLRHDRPGIVRRGYSDLRYRRRSAGGDDRPSLFRAGNVEGDLRHRLFRVAQYRAHAGGIGQQASDDDRLSAWRRTQLRARRLDLHRRSRGAMAARQLAHRAKRRRRPVRWRRPPIRRKRSSSSRLSSGSARPIGGRTCAARCSA